MKNAKRIILILLLVIWSSTITSFSAQTGEKSVGLSVKVTTTVVGFLYRNYDELPVTRQTEIFDTWHLLIRKCAHMTEYAILAVIFCMLALTFEWFAGTLNRFHWKAIIITLIFTVVFATTDELHQGFVEGRNPSITDIIIDTVGAFLGLILLDLILILRVKSRKTRIHR